MTETEAGSFCSSLPRGKRCARIRCGGRGNSMKCLSLDHNKADADVRRRAAFSSSRRAALSDGIAGGAVVLVTCNRTEIYFCAERENAERALVQTAPEAPPFSFYGEGDAEKHLFRLAAGLCSMLVGEDEILGQIRGAYEEARQNGRSKGMDDAFQAALACGKKVRAQTGISSYACSLATLAANAVFRFKEGEKRALVVGATGQIGASVLKNLVSGGVRVTATSRSHNFSAGVPDAECAPYAERYALLRGADAIVSCTASPHIVFEAEKTAKHCGDGRPRLFIDLAVPPDIDPRVGLLGNCRLLGIDGFRAAAEENNAKKRSAAEEAEKIAAGCLAEYFAGEAAKRCAARIAALGDDKRKAAYALKKSDPAAFCAYCRALEENG